MCGRSGTPPDIDPAIFAVFRAEIFFVSAAARVDGEMS